jgi:superfamily II DNA or RNA helicase
MTRLRPPDWVEARPYQREAISKWLNAGGTGMLRMATGTGKTVTALLAASHVAEAVGESFLLVVAVPYQHLVDQWASDLREFGADPVLAYQSRRGWQPRLERELLELNNGLRDGCVVVTTHRTLSGEPAQQTLRRGQGRSMLIGDEVHHLGAEHTQKALMDEFDLRLALSATPERWYDEEGTQALGEYFGGTVFEYGLDEAIAAGFLCEYYYVPHIVTLQDDEMEEYLRLTSKIGRLMASAGDEDGVVLDGNQALQTALFKRARLIGTAREKLDLLVDLFERGTDHRYSLVYCGGGSMGVDEEGERHVDETTQILRDACGLTVERFTAREDQGTREQLLSAFEAGEIEVLTSIRCLDEGVDVPATRTAYLLASTSNPRQYVQRRGRILRQHEGKQFAVIHDFIAVPDPSRHPELLSEEKYSAERTLIRKELERVSMFADSARNHPDADVDGVPTSEGTLQSLRRRYDLLSEDV